MATAFLWAGLIAAMAGLLVWYGLGFTAMFRDPEWTEAFTFSPMRAMDFQLRNMRAAGDLGHRTGLGRIANSLLAIVATCLMAAGIAKVIALVAARQGGRVTATAIRSGVGPYLYSLLAALSLGPASGWACAVEEPFSLAGIARSPVVVTGTVSNYRPGQRGEATFTLSVDAVLSGSAPETLRALWPPSMGEGPPRESMGEGPPRDWNRPDRIVAGFRQPDADGTFELVVVTCGFAMLTGADAVSVAEVQALLP